MPKGVSQVGTATKVPTSSPIGHTSDNTSSAYVTVPKYAWRGFSQGDVDRVERLVLQRSAANLIVGVRLHDCCQESFCLHELAKFHFPTAVTFD